MASTIKITARTEKKEIGGQVFTPEPIVALMVEKLFQRKHPKRDDSVLDPGCGAGAFIKGVLNWCTRKGIEAPRIVGIEFDSKLLGEARKSFEGLENVTLINENFLLGDFETFDFIIGNPPYVRLEGLSESERETYRKMFDTAVNRFDLYMLFFEKALKSLKPSGRLVFITPEKYEYTLTTRPLRKLMARYHVEEIHHVSEDVFKDLVTYPTITTINGSGRGPTKVIHRDGSSITIKKIPADGSRWVLAIKGGAEPVRLGLVLADVCLRISCGVATGADEVFVMPKEGVPESLKPYAHPTIGGEQLTKGVRASDVMLIPYDRSGGLLPEEKLKNFKRWFSKHKKHLSSRYCVRKGKHKWYSFHENPPMSDILRPKILCKDIAKEPKFWTDPEGNIVPRHSVYYIVPKDPKILYGFLGYLNSEKVHRWLVARCQRAANDFMRLQSSVLKDIPILSKWVERQ